MNFKSRFEWAIEAETQGRSTDKLNAICQRMRRKARLDALLIIWNDSVVYEYYGNGHHRYLPHYIASLAKPLVGGIVTISLLTEGIINVDNPACLYIPQWKDDPQRSKITLLHLITHTSGLGDAKPKDAEGSWCNEFWHFPKHYTVARDKIPLYYEPGKGAAYSNPAYAMLSYCLTVALQQCAEKNIKTYLKERVMKRIGVPDDQWLLDWDDELDPSLYNPETWGAGNPAVVNGLNIFASWGGASYSPDAIARLGRLILNKGRWGTEQLLAKKWVDRSLESYGSFSFSTAPSKEHRPPLISGFGWKSNANGALGKIPPDAFFGSGRGQQSLLVVPSLNLIAVRLGELMRGEHFFDGLIKLFFEPLVDALE